MRLQQRIRRFLIRTYWNARKFIWFVRPKVRHSVRTLRSFKQDFYFILKFSYKLTLFLFRQCRYSCKAFFVQNYKKTFFYNFWILTGNTTKERIGYHLDFWRDFFGSFQTNYVSIQNAQIFCMFIGYSRSGNSLLGSLIDAHPNAVIAHEADAAGLVKLGFSRKRVFSFLAANARRYANKHRFASDYSYFVPDSAQGLVEDISVIGDKESPLTALRLHFNPGLYEKIRKKTGIPIKMIHMTRNPYDIIATMALRSRQKKYGHQKYADVTAKDLWMEAKSLFFLMRSVHRVHEQHGREMLTIAHEDLLADPQTTLVRVCDFLGLSTNAEYLERCAAIVFKKPHAARFEVTWPEELQHSIAEEIMKYSYFTRYHFND